MKYALVVEREANTFVGSFPDFPWCEYPGETIEDALRETIAALEFHFRGLLEDGDPIPEPRARVEEVHAKLPASLGLGESIRYRVVVDRTPRNHGAYVPDLPGCIAAEDGFEDTLALMTEAIGFHLETMVEYGDPIPPRNSLVEMVDVLASQPVSVAEVAD